MWAAVRSLAPAAAALRRQAVPCASAAALQRGSAFAGCRVALRAPHAAGEGRAPLHVAVAPIAMGRRAAKIATRKVRPVLAGAFPRGAGALDVRQSGASPSLTRRRCPGWLRGCVERAADMVTGAPGGQDRHPQGKAAGASHQAALRASGVG